MNDEPKTNALTTAGGKPVEIATGGQLAGIAPQSIDEAWRLSQALSKAGDMVPTHFQNKPELIMAAVLKGAEVGLMPMQALSNIAVINGRSTIWGDALPALMQRAGHHIDVELTGEGNDMVATATLTRGDTGKTIVREFSVKDAEKAKLWGKAGPWQQYPKRMLSMRARAWAVRDGAADAMMGLQVAEEVSDYGPDTARDVTPRGGAFTAMAQKARGRDVQISEKAEEIDQRPAIEPEDVSQDTVEGEVDDGHWTDAVDATAAFPGSDEFTEGAKAAQAGGERTECPYQSDLAQACDWLGGWDQAQGAGE